MNNFVNELYIDNFKCFLDETISLGNLTVLGGANSVGKSTVIQSLLLSRIIIEQRLKNEITIPINGLYLLALGNTRQVLSKDAQKDLFYFALKLEKEEFLEFYLDVPKGLYAYNLNVVDIIYRIEDKEISLMDSIKKISDLLTRFSLCQSCFYYLNAERLGPRIRHEISSLPFLHTGYKGEYTIQVLRELIEIDEKVDFRRAFDTTKSRSYLEQVRLWMDYIAPGVEISVPTLYEKVQTAEMTFGESVPTNVGFGISYILPIIVNALLAEEGSMLIIENPEAHLHPLGQSRMGQFLAKIAAAGVQIVIETHSEHVINGIRIAALKKVIPNNEVVINFFSKSQNNQAPTVTKIDINEKGELSEWPIGFFDQEEQDLSEIFKLTRKK